MSAVVDFVSDAIDTVGDAVSGVVDAVGDVGQGIIDAASDAVDYVAENPLLLVAAVAAPFALEALAFDAAVGTTALGGYDLAMADAAMSLSAGEAAAASLAAADAAAGLIPEVAPAAAEAAAGTTGLTGLDTALEVPSAQEAVQVGQQALESTGTSLQVADPSQVFGPPAEVDPLEQIINTTTSAPESELAGLTEEQLAALQEGTLAAPENVLSEEALSSQTVSGPSVVGPAEPGYDLMGRPIDDTAWGGIKNLASAYWENPLALLGTAYGVYSGVNLLDKVLSGGNESAANNTSSDVANQTSINEPIQGKPITNRGLEDLYDYSKLSRDAQAREAIKQPEVNQDTPIKFRDLLAASQAQSITPNYVRLEDILKSAGKT